MKLPERVTRTVALTVFKAKKNSPHIFFAAGVIGAVGSTVMACKATRKLDDRLEYVKKDVDDARALVEASKAGHSTVPMKEACKELSVATGKATLEVVKLYAPAAAVGVVSIGFLAGSHVQLTRRNGALTMAIGALGRSFDEYRGRVRAKYGEEEENKIYRNIEEIETVDDKGKKIIAEAIKGPSSLHSKLFGPENPEWKKNSEMNRAFLMAVQKHANNMLDAHGVVMLNEVYKDLGFPPTSGGQLYGWERDPAKPGKIDFGIFEPRNSAFLAGLEYQIWLDFNVDGVVFGLLEND